MRMIHFIDPHSGEKKQDRHEETKEHIEEIRQMARFEAHYEKANAGRQLQERSNTAFGRFKRWLLVFLHRECL